MKIPAAYIILIVFLLSNSFVVYGQNKTETKIPRNSIYTSGSSLWYVGMYALSYERAMYQRNSLKVWAAVGIGGWYFTTISELYKGYSIPISVTTLYGRKNNFFEVDLGFRYTVFSKDSDTGISPYYPELNLGYRYQRSDGKGLLFRAFIGLSGVGIGVGKAF